MKPRVMIAWRNFRLVRGPGGSFLLEKLDGRDAMNAPRWRSASDECLWSVLQDFGRALEVREKRARRRR